MISALRNYFLALANFAACTSSLATSCNFCRFKAWHLCIVDCQPCVGCALVVLVCLDALALTLTLGPLPHAQIDNVFLKDCVFVGFCLQFSSFFLLLHFA
ncbi:hypothetical protein C8R42DRAFT_341301 [Lentinula raphanica]|nr:hypothetical protein C8R42DRAFT_341301 [Lentinula raphanica]